MKEVDQLPWPRAMALWDYWLAHPPMHIAISRLLVGMGFQSDPRGHVEPNAIESQVIDPSNALPFQELPEYAREFLTTAAKEVTHGK